MTDLNTMIERYMAIWNETEPAKRRDLIAETFTEDAIHQGPWLSGEGYEGIDALARGIQEHLPGYQFRRTGEIDAHHDRYRITWEILPAGGEPRFAAGTDIGEVASDGRVRAVTVFLDQAPDHP